MDYASWDIRSYMFSPLSLNFNISLTSLLTFQVIVILIICVVSLLVLYMLFLLCLDPLMSRRPKTYMEQHNEEVNLDTHSVTQRICDEEVRGCSTSSTSLKMCNFETKLAAILIQFFLSIIYKLNLK